MAGKSCVRSPWSITRKHGVPSFPHSIKSRGAAPCLPFRCLLATRPHSPRRCPSHDVYLFAGISGDFSPEHTDAVFMGRTKFKQRIAHGALTVAFMSAASGKLTTAVSERLGHGGPTPVALGFDRVRFLKPVFFGNTLITTYTVEAIDERSAAPSRKLKSVTSMASLPLSHSTSTRGFRRRPRRRVHSLFVEDQAGSETD